MQTLIQNGTVVRSTGAVQADLLIENGLIQKIAIRYGAKLIFQYLQNRDGAVIIDFKKVYD